MARGAARSSADNNKIISEDGLEELPPPAHLPDVVPKISGTRLEAIERGRALGEDEASRRREGDGELRISRAMAYAAWEFDGRPMNSREKYRKEFKIGN